MSGEDDDDEALTWAGARDPSLYEAPETKPAKPSTVSAPRSARRAKPGDVDAAGADDRDDDRDSEDDADSEDDRAPGMSSVVLVCLGILGGIYALYTIGWFVSWQRLLYTDSDALELAAFHVQQVLGILAPPLWFVVTILVTRRRKPTVRLLWLVIGALLLVPWSFTFGQ